MSVLKRARNQYFYCRLSILYRACGLFYRLEYKRWGLCTHTFDQSRHLQMTCRGIKVVVDNFKHFLNYIHVLVL